MAFSLNSFFAPTGTRFRLFAQAPVLTAFAVPETVWVSSPAGTLGPGPSDHRMYALSPIGKEPYGPEDAPPYRGPSGPPALPGADGHFDWIDVEDPAFLAAHVFGSARRILDIWEIYLGGPINWHFDATHDRLELITRVDWDNAHFGWGFLECGSGADDAGEKRAFALNFDVLAHEIGHGLVFGLAGVPSQQGLTRDYRGFHESASDCVAMISALHFDSFLDHVLRVSEGDLYVANEMNRIGELSATRQIRVASNAIRLTELRPSTVPAAEMGGKEVHGLGEPMTGAFFDIMVEYYEDRLVDAGLLSRTLAEKTRADAAEDRLDPEVGAATRNAFREEPEGFRMALCDARDMLGLRLAETWRRLDPEHLSLARVTRTFLDADRFMSGRDHRRLAVEAFRWRGFEID